MYYLLFCTMSVAWLTVGIVVTVQTVLSSRAVNSSLSQLGKAAAVVEVDYLRHGTENFQALVERFRAESQLAHCAIVSSDGKYLAHTSRDVLGERALEPTGERLRWGDVDGVRYINAQAQTLREYRTPLVAKDEPIGSLRIAVAEPSLSSTLLAVGEVAPLAVLAPLAFIGIGAVVLGKISRPVERIESQLRRAASAAPGTKLDLKALAARDGLSLGWNRVVASFESRSDEGDLDEHLRKALQIRNQAKSDGVLDSLSDGIAVTDNEGRISFTNRAFPSLLGLRVDANELRGASIESQLVGDRDMNGASELFEKTTNHAAVGTIERESAKGNRILRVARVPLRSVGTVEDGSSVWTIRDVTQQKAADVVRDQFIDTVTHELRTPLANIKAYAETLADTAVLDVESQKEFCNTINSEATRLARFVDDLLCISSIEAGSLTANIQNVETGRLLEEVINKVKPLAEHKSITFDVALGAKLPEMHLDKDKIDATLVNLLGNAIKYTPEGGRVGLRARVNDSTLQIDIEDTGVGISEEELPKIFDKFFRSSDPRVQQESGTGLGLSLAREVIRLHRGELTVESEVNKGSTFTLTLPLESS